MSDEQHKPSDVIHSDHNGMEYALAQFESRTADRLQRNVEGINKP